jgi:hypothetical protein
MPCFDLKACPFLGHAARRPDGLQEVGANRRATPDWPGSPEGDVILMPRKKPGQRPPGRNKQEPEVRTHYEVSAEEFAMTWNRSGSAQEAAETLGMPLPIVQARVSNYRKRGVNLKKMPRKNSRRLDVAKLNECISEKCSLSDGQGGPDYTSGLLQLALVVINEGEKAVLRRSFTVRLHLLEGTPGGLRIAERANSTLRAVACPRSQFPAAKTRPEFQRPGVYILVGPAETGDRAKVYVGEGDPSLPRLEMHSSWKEFWTWVVLFTSRDGSLHKAHAQFLEAKLTALAKAGGRAVLDNANMPQVPSLSEPDEAEAEGFLDEALLLAPVVGLTCFDSPGPIAQEGSTAGRAGEHTNG